MEPSLTNGISNEWIILVIIIVGAVQTVANKYITSITLGKMVKGMISESFMDFQSSFENYTNSNAVILERLQIMANHYSNKLDKQRSKILINIVVRDCLMVIKNEANEILDNNNLDLNKSIIDKTIKDICSLSIENMYTVLNAFYYKDNNLADYFDNYENEGDNLCRVILGLMYDKTLNSNKKVTKINDYLERIAIKMSNETIKIM